MTTFWFYLQIQLTEAHLVRLVGSQDVCSVKTYPSTLEMKYLCKGLLHGSSWPMAVT